MKGLLPPAIFMIAIGLMFALHGLMPDPALHRSWLQGLGACLAVVGLGTSAWGSRLFERAGTNIKPFGRPQRFVRSGPFRYSRNPMYLGFAVCQAGVWALLGSLAPGIVIPIFMMVIWWRFIRFEEQIMAETFGEEYAAYRSATRRWI